MPKAEGPALAAAPACPSLSNRAPETCAAIRPKAGSTRPNTGCGFGVEPHFAVISNRFDTTVGMAVRTPAKNLATTFWNRRRLHEKQGAAHHLRRPPWRRHHQVDDRHSAHPLRRRVRRRSHPAVLHPVRRRRRRLRPDRPHQGRRTSRQLGRRRRTLQDPRHHGRRHRQPHELGIQAVPGRAGQGRGVRILSDVPHHELRLPERRHRRGPGRHLPSASGPAVHPLQVRRQDALGLGELHPAAGGHRHRFRQGLGIPHVDFRPDGRLPRQLHPPRRRRLRRQGSRHQLLHDPEDLQADLPSA